MTDRPRISDEDLMETDRDSHHLSSTGRLTRELIEARAAARAHTSGQRERLRQGHALCACLVCIYARSLPKEERAEAPPRPEHDRASVLRSLGVPVIELPLRPADAACGSVARLLAEAVVRGDQGDRRVGIENALIVFADAILREVRK